MTKPQIDVSIVVPVFNGSGFIQRTIDALQLESSNSIQVVFVDDCSSDDSLEKIQAGIETMTNAKVIALDRNGGVARARKHGVENSDGAFIWFVDADDSWKPGTATILFRDARDSQVDVVICGAQYVYGNGSKRTLHPRKLQGEMTGAEAFAALLSGEVKGHLWNKLFSKDLFIGLDYTSARVHSDLAMVGQLLAAAHRVSVVDEILYSYEIRSGSIITSSKARTDSLNIVENALEKSLSSLDEGRKMASLFTYFQHRFFILSALKDSQSDAYDQETSTRLFRSARRRITWEGLFEMARRKDWKRGLALLATKISPAGFKLSSRIGS